MLPVLCTQTGDSLIEFHPDAALERAATLFSVPLVFVMIIARHQGKVLFILNAARQEWEIPAGGIEADESPYDAALRELKEESGQDGGSLTYGGLALLRMVDERLEPGVLYLCDLDTVQPFTSDGETTDLMFWDLQAPVVGQIDEISVWLIQQFSQRPAEDI